MYRYYITFVHLVRQLHTKDMYWVFTSVWSFQQSKTKPPKNSRRNGYRWQRACAWLPRMLKQSWDMVGVHNFLAFWRKDKYENVYKRMYFQERLYEVWRPPLLMTRKRKNSSWIPQHCQPLSTGLVDVRLLNLTLSFCQF